MPTFKMKEIVRYKKHNGLFLITGIDETSIVLPTTYSITDKRQEEKYIPEKIDTHPTIVFHSVKKEDLEKYRI